MQDLIKAFENLMESHGVKVKVELQCTCPVNVNDQIKTHQKLYECLAKKFDPDIRVEKVKS